MIELTTECIQEILKHVQIDNNLFSCLLINRVWCENVIKILWSNPFKYKKIYNKRKRYKFLNNYLKSLNQKEKNWLTQQRIELTMFQPKRRTPRKKPSQPTQNFDYASYLKVIRFNNLDPIITNWIEYYYRLKEPQVAFLKFHSGI